MKYKRRTLVFHMRKYQPEKSSRRKPARGAAPKRKGLLSERRHQCKKCGLDLDGYVNAGYVILNYALTGSVMGQELALGVEKKTLFLAETRNSINSVRRLGASGSLFL